MIQDIYPNKLNNQYNCEAKPKNEDYVLSFEKTKILVSAKEEITYPCVKDFGLEQEYIYLFEIDGMSYYLLEQVDQIPEGFEYLEVKAIRGMKLEPKFQRFASVTGKHLYDWYRDTKHCGRCGATMQHSKKERAMVCEACGYTVYPRIMPAVIVGVTNENQLLLTKYRVGYGNNALIAGFTEIGETLEETVAREVMEEVGLCVKNIRYYKSQPWGIANDILMGFYCDVDGDTNITMDEDELKYAQWVEREEIELQPEDSSLTNEMMKMFKEKAWKGL